VGYNTHMHVSHSFHRLLSSLAAALAMFVGGTAPAVAQTADHQYSPEDITAGSRLYAAQCTLCHGPLGDGVSGINLRQQRFRRPLSDEQLRQVVTTGVPNTGMPPFRLQPRELDGLIAFIRAGFDVTGTAVKSGDAARGRQVYDRAGCASCHRIDGVGPRSAPDLSDIGSIRQPSAIQRSLLTPTEGMMPINRPIRIVTKDGQTVRGRRLNEDTVSVQIIDDKEQLRSIAKADMKEMELGKTSPMPSVSGKLSDAEVADLVAYLLSLKGL
jgi:putative heme-binding domain-containing protein